MWSCSSCSAQSDETLQLIGSIVLKYSVDTLTFQEVLYVEWVMKPSEALQINRSAIRRVVETHRASNARVFGSVVHGDDTHESDLDLLIDPTPDTTLLDIGAIRRELRALLGVPVDVLTPQAIPEHFRDSILAEAVRV